MIYLFKKPAMLLRGILGLKSLPVPLLQSGILFLPTTYLPETFDSVILIKWHRQLPKLPYKVIQQYVYIISILPTDFTTSSTVYREKFAPVVNGWILGLDEFQGIK